MLLRPLSDVGVADWIVAAHTGGFDVVSLGAPGFEAYVRLLHPLAADDDPSDVEGDLGDALLFALCEVLARHTPSRNDAYFCLWDGFGLDGGASASVTGAAEGSDVSPPGGASGLRRAFAPGVMDLPRVDLGGGRTYLVFEGPLSAAGHWGGDPSHGRINSPNLFWPADRAWCVATDIDLPWTGIGGSRALVDELHEDDRFDVVTADPRTDQPYR